MVTYAEGVDRRMRRALATGISAGVVAALLTASPVTAASPAATAPPDAAVAVVAAGEGEIPAAASALVGTMTLREKAAGVVMTTISTTDVDTLRAYVKRTGVGGFILMGSNIPGNESGLRQVTAALTGDPALPTLIAVDEEGGDVTRLPWDQFPSALTLKAQAPAQTQDAFLGRGALVQRAGIGVNFGIIADVTDNRNAFIYRRALGVTPDASAVRVAAAVRGEGAQTMSTLKHFPGHGAAAGDSHSLIPTTSRSRAAWEQQDAVSFRAGIAAGAPILMFGHLRFTAVDKAPATLSAAWHEIARKDLGFTGVAITDDLGMLQATGIPAYDSLVDNAVAALAAGNDMVLAIMFTTSTSAPRIIDGIVAAVESGALSQARLDEAVTRVVSLRLKIAADGRGMIPCADCAPAN